MQKVTELTSTGWELLGELANIVMTSTTENITVKMTRRVAWSILIDSRPQEIDDTEFKFILGYPVVMLDADDNKTYVVEDE